MKEEVGEGREREVGRKEGKGSNTNGHVREKGSILL